MANCGAKTRNGGLCQKPPLRNKSRCALHGGKSTGAPKRHKNSVKHGIYSKFYSDEEIGLLDHINLSSIDEEIKLTTVQLNRALHHQKLRQEHGDVLEQQSLTTKPTLFGGIPDYNESLVEEKTYIKRDIVQVIDRLVARLAQLKKQRNELVSQKLDIQIKQISLERFKAESNPPDNTVQINIVRVGKKDEN